MADAKIEFTVGGIAFRGEGSEKWLSGELDRILEKIPALAKVAPAMEGGGAGDDAIVAGTNGNLKKANVGTLAGFLKEKNATDNQRRKFLATAAWLHDKDGQSRLTTGQVKKALSTANQGKLTNPSASLNDNVAQGLCEKEGKTFYVTPAGRTALG